MKHCEGDSEDRKLRDSEVGGSNPLAPTKTTKPSATWIECTMSKFPYQKFGTSIETV